MKVDVVIDFFRKHKQWPLVKWGLEQNADYINRVIVVNDEPWEKHVDPVSGVKTVYLDHERNGFGAHKSIRQGAEAVETEYFAHVDGDVVLAPGSLKQNLGLVDAELFTLGVTHDVSRDLSLGDLPNPLIERYDWRLRDPSPVHYPMFRDLHWIARKADYFAIGGHDLNYKSYGLVDYDLGVRWMARFGVDSYVLGSGEAYHVGGLGRPGDKVSKQRDEDNYARFKAALKEFADAIEAQPQ